MTQAAGRERGVFEWPRRRSWALGAFLAAVLVVPPAQAAPDAPPACGGIVGWPCPKGLVCVDYPGDNCDPTIGGADCVGVCIPPGTRPTGIPPSRPHAPDAASPRHGTQMPDDELPPNPLPPSPSQAGGVCGGVADLRCAPGLVCSNDPTNDCAPAGGRDCAGVCLPPDPSENPHQEPLPDVPLGGTPPLPPAPLPVAAHCEVRGCNSELCVDASSPEVATPCMLRPEFACLRRTSCGPHGRDGACGWEQTPVYRHCLEQLNANPVR